LPRGPWAGPGSRSPTRATGFSHDCAGLQGVAANELEAVRRGTTRVSRGFGGGAQGGRGVNTCRASLMLCKGPVVGPPRQGTEKRAHGVRRGTRPVGRRPGPADRGNCWNRSNVHHAHRRQSPSVGELGPAGVDAGPHEEGHSWSPRGMASLGPVEVQRSRFSHSAAAI